MQSVRRDYEWQRLLDQIAMDRRSRVVTGKSEPLPLEDILLADPSMDGVRDRILGDIPGMESPVMTPYSFASAEKLLEFSPIDVVERISPRPILYVVAGKDTICPASHAVDMYNRTEEPKKLWVIPDISHYSVYGEPYKSQIFDLTTDWVEGTRPTVIRGSCIPYRGPVGP